MGMNKVLLLVSFILVVIGAINWGLAGLFGIDLVHYLFGGIPVLMKVVYILVGLAGLVMLSLYKKLMD